MTRLAEMDKVSNTMVIHCGGRMVSRAELARVPTPPPTGRFHRPVPHIELIDALTQGLKAQHFEITREQLAIAGKFTDEQGREQFGEWFFASLTLENKNGFSGFARPGQGFALGLRSNNRGKSKIEAKGGLSVFVCDNMAFSGESIVFLRKHTSGLKLEPEVREAVIRYMEVEERLITQTDRAREIELVPSRAKEILYDVFAQKMLPTRCLPHVHDNYFTPEPEWKDITEFPNTLWSLHNACTRVLAPRPRVEGEEAVEHFTPQAKFKATSRLGKLLAMVS